MRTVRMARTAGPFARGQKVEVFQERGEDLYLRGLNLNDVMQCRETVVSGPFRESDVEEYVPEPVGKTVQEKLKEVWP